MNPDDNQPQPSPQPQPQQSPQPQPPQPQPQPYQPQPTAQPQQFQQQPQPAPQSQPQQLQPQPQQYQPQSMAQPQQPQTFQQPQPMASNPPPQQQPQPQPVAPQPQSIQQPQPVAQPQQFSEPATPGDMSSHDYLEAISSKQKKVLGFSRKQLIVIGATLLGVIIFLITAALMSSARPSVNNLGYTVLARSSALQEVASTSQKSIQSRDLVPLNGSLSVQLASTSANIKTALTDTGINTKKIPKDIAADESNEQLLEKLEDARLSGTFDRVYASEMAYHLQTLIVTIDQLTSITSDKDSELKSQLKSNYDDLKKLQEQLSEFNEGF